MEEDIQKRLFDDFISLIILSVLPVILGLQDLAPNISAYLLKLVAKVSQGLSLHLSG
jgi:hypothetical protein